MERLNFAQVKSAIAPYGELIKHPSGKGYQILMTVQGRTAPSQRFATRPRRHITDHFSLKQAIQWARNQRAILEAEAARLPREAYGKVGGVVPFAYNPTPESAEKRMMRRQFGAGVSLRDVEVGDRIRQHSTEEWLEVRSRPLCFGGMFLVRVADSQGEGDRQFSADCRWSLLAPAAATAI